MSTFMYRKWISIKNDHPEDGMKLYFFTKDKELFLGTFQYQQYRHGNPNVFHGANKLLTADDITHWMLYDHLRRDQLPLPPDYYIAEEVSVPDDQRTFNFTYVNSEDLQ